MSLNNYFNEVTKQWTQVIQEPFANHPFGSFFRNDLKSEVKQLVSVFNEAFLIKASVGAGNWASVPWVSILNPEITTTTQAGIYPVYLFREDGTGFYLSLGFGTTKLREAHGLQGARDAAEKLREKLRTEIPDLSSWDERIDLRSNTILGQSYEWASGGAKFYTSDNIPTDDVLKKDLYELLRIYDKCVGLEIEETDVEIAPREIKAQRYLFKSFLLLAGISGTGKTRFVREQADDDLSNYQLVSVRPDWHEPSDLLGYVTRLTQPEQYVATEVLFFIVKAWKEVVSHGFELSGKTASGDTSNIENIRPFWLCLDEMNLAPVEQYFADYLSVSETRRWLNDGDELIYSCDTLLNPDLINSVDRDKLKKDLALDDGEDVSDKLWAHFRDNGISIPFNLIVAGTVNMDETTHGFSRKVIDRALSFDFGEFFPNIFSEFFEPTSSPKSLNYPIWSHADKDSLATTCDPDGERTINFLEAINEKLDGTPFKLAYRALNEILLSVIANHPKSEQELLAVWDDFVMCKLLPRVEGDLDKLSSKEDNKSLLQVLSEALADNDMLGLIWDEQKDSPNARPDLYREKTEGDDKVIRIPCRSREKLDWMQARLERDTFTSFWP